MNILIKLMSIVSLVIAPYIAIKSAEQLQRQPGNSQREGIEAVGGINGVDLEKSTAADNANISTPNDDVELTDLTLDGGVALKGVNAKGIEANLLDFVKSDKVVDKETWFDFDRLTFETGKATLKPESQEQLKNIAEILKAYPAVNIKLGGYTDNTGNANSNLKLSGDRAVSVKGELAKLGIDDSRLEAEGYGQEHPVAPNDTEEGMAQNRRISVRVTKK